jgi:hypothetical protein
MQQPTEVATRIVLAHAPKSSSFPTMTEMERAMILAAYQRSNRKPLEAPDCLESERPHSTVSCGRQTWQHNASCSCVPPIRCQ